MSHRWNRLLARFPPEVRASLQAMIYGGGVLPAAEVVDVAARCRVSVPGLMVRLLPIAAAFAVPPISKFRVGAVVQARPGRGQPAGALYLGANLEFTGQALWFGVHAEQAAVNNAWLHGAPGLASLAVTAAPCGYCRQFLWELPGAAQLDVLLQAGRGRHTTTRLADLLPKPFGPADLKIRARFMDPSGRRHRLRLRSDAGDALVHLALEAARRCYAPYSRRYAGCAVQTDDGQAFAGRLAENAAYNPSLGPMGSALSLAAMHRPAGRPRRVVRAVLVEAATSQLLSAEAIAPVAVERYEAR